MKAYRIPLIALLCACLLVLVAGCAPTGIGAMSSSSTPSTAPSAGIPHEVELTLAGGSGRASVESPAKVTVEPNGTLTLTVVWSSSHYDKMVVNGVEYQPINTEGNSTFCIPVASLDEDLPVQAQTTAMSQPHLVDYVLSFHAPNVAADTESTQTTTQVANFHNADIGNGWQPIKSLPLQYATCFTVDYFEGGYKLVCVSDGSRYLAVPEGAAVPAGISSDISIIQQPLSDVYLVASDTMCLFQALNALDCITVSGIARNDWYLPSAQQAMDSGSLVYGGKYNTPDYELLLSKKVKLALESTMINHTPSVREKLIELGIPVFTEMSSYEASPLGRTEWVKCYGALLNKEDVAQAQFNEQVAQVSSVDSAQTGKTVAFFYINSNGNAVVRKPGDYVSKMIEQAGGTTAFNQLDETEGSMSSVTLEMERFYAMAKDADIIMYNASIDGSVSSLNDLLSKNTLLKDFKAVQQGNVWITNQSMYQQMMQSGRIIADFHVAITGSNGDTTFVQKLG